MALSNFRREEVAKSAFSILGGSKGQMRPGEIARRIIERYGGMTDIQDQNQVVATVNQTIRAAAEGEAIQLGAGTAVATLRNTDWALFSELGTYGYRVRVTATDPLTGDTIEQLHIVSSDRPLSADAIRARAEADFLRTAPVHETNKTAIAEIQGRQIGSEILTAGRRP